MFEDFKEKTVVWFLTGAKESAVTGKLNLRTRIVTYLIERGAKKMNLNGSWQPKVMAIIGALTAIAGAIKALIDGDPATNPDWTVLFTTISMAVGLFTTRQDNKSSEQVGAGNTGGK